MNYILIALYAIAAMLLCALGFSYQNGKHTLSVEATSPADDRKYWETMTDKLKKGYFVGAIGSLLAAVALTIRNPLAAEIGGITLLSSLVFGLAFLCRKTSFRPCPATEKLRNRWKGILLAASFLALLMVQQIFQLFTNKP